VCWANENNVLKSFTSSKTTKRVSINDYIMGSKSMMFLTSSQIHFKLVFDSSYLLYFCNKSVVYENLC